MIVQRIQCYHYNEAFNIPFHSPQAKRLRADSVIVYLDCGSDGCGWGESAPRSYVTGEDVQSVLTVWEQVFAPILFEQEFHSLEDIERLLLQLEEACLEQGHNAYNSALGAADLALIDVLGRSGLLEDKQIFPNNYREALRFSISVPFIASSAIEKYFPTFNARFDNPVIKILINADSENNFRRVQQLRRLAGEEAEIRLEVNGKLNRDQVVKEMERLLPFHPSAIEEPLPGHDFNGLRQLRESSGLAIIVDESLVSFDDAEKLLAAKACDIFNIKISKCGGLLRSRAIAKLAAQSGINCQVGTHVGESELLGIAGRQLARSIPNFDCYGGGSQVLLATIPEHNKGKKNPEKLETFEAALKGRPSVSPEAPCCQCCEPLLDLRPLN
jgi:muconate cycloisomerase